jgi:copper homeostasis protein
MTLLEVCVADPASLAAAVAGGAERIELCSSLELGGLTPAPGLIRMAAATGIPVYALVRSRSGDFVYDEADVEAMIGDIAAIRAAGLAGVVLGASLPNGALDGEVLRRLREAAEGLGTTLHRAFDLVPAIEPAVEVAVELRFERILTSGRAADALSGVADIVAAHRAAVGRISIMAGAGLRPDNVGELLASVPLNEVHSSCSIAVAAQGVRAVDLGFAAPTRKQTDAEEIRRMKAAIGASART